MKPLLALALMASLFCVAVGIDQLLNDKQALLYRVDDYSSYMEHVRNVTRDLALPVALPLAVVLICAAFLFRRTGVQAPGKQKPVSAWARPDDDD